MRRLPLSALATLAMFSLPMPAFPSPATAGAPAGGAHSGPPAKSAPAQASSRLVFQLPTAWVREAPGSAMRLAQATIRGKDGPAQFAVFFFGVGGGGSAAANLDRWREQIIRPTAPRQDGSFTVRGLKVSWTEVVGTMKPSAVGMGPTELQVGWRLLGAVVEGPGGPWFFKVTGPDTTVAAAHGAFLKMLEALRLK